jgi:mannose-6-phosphate isomerase-like protein (cupin superfamily)
MPFGNEFWIRPQEAYNLLPGERGERSARVLEQPGLEVEIYAPRGIDTQAPHDRDEVYFVISGNGMFRNGERRHSFAPGDLMFVPAGVEHGFESFSEDLAVWVVFATAGRPPA